MARTGEIIIGEDGEVSIDLKGFKGVGCDAVMAVLLKDSTPLSTKKKPEYTIKTVNLVNQ